MAAKCLHLYSSVIVSADMYNYTLLRRSNMTAALEPSFGGLETWTVREWGGSCDWSHDWEAAVAARESRQMT